MTNIGMLEEVRKKLVYDNEFFNNGKFVTSFCVLILKITISKTVTKK